MLKNEVMYLLILEIRNKKVRNKRTERDSVKRLEGGIFAASSTSIINLLETVGRFKDLSGISEMEAMAANVGYTFNNHTSDNTRLFIVIILCGGGIVHSGKTS